ncbi:hypothetical protein QFZ82_000343 [Streptomyces sp. V4I23]|nr:hypothetical protein [Streptomyces sp. V4I23]
MDRVLTLLFAGMAVATEATATTGRWWWAGVVGALWLASLIYMINCGYGRTLLAPSNAQDLWVNLELHANSG